MPTSPLRFRQVLSHLPLSAVLLSLAPASRKLALAAEPTFEAFCRRHAWRPPRRLKDHPFVHRMLLRTRACSVCLEPNANFPVRRGAGGAAAGAAVAFRLCRSCARRDKVQQQISAHGLEVDALGVDGKALFARQFHVPLFGHTNGFSSDLRSKLNAKGL